MKRCLCLVISILLLAVLLAGCGSGSAAPTANKTGEALAAATQAPAAAPLTTETEAPAAPEETQAPAAPEETSIPVVPEGFQFQPPEDPFAWEEEEDDGTCDVPILSAEVFEDERLKVTVTKVKGYEDTMDLKVLVENKSDEALDFTGTGCSVNGLSVDSVTFKDDGDGRTVEPGGQNRFSITLFVLDSCGITSDTVAEIRTSFRYGEAGGSWGQMTVTEPLTVALDQQAEALDLTGKPVLYDDRGVKLILLGRSDDGRGIRLYAENHTSGEVVIYTDDSVMNIDGRATAFRWSVSLTPGESQTVLIREVTVDGVSQFVDGEIREVTLAFKLNIPGATQELSSETVTETY